MGISVGIGRGYGFILNIEELQPSVRDFLDQREYDPDDLYEDSEFVSTMRDEFPGLRFNFTPAGNYEPTKYLIVVTDSTYNFTWADNLKEEALLLSSSEETVDERFDLASLTSSLNILPSAVGWVSWVTVL